MLFAICNWGEENVESWGPGIAQMYRTQMDHIPFWQYPAKAAGVGYGQGTREIIDFMADLHPAGLNGPYQWMDPDFLETLFNPLEDIYSTMNYTNSRTEMAFWVLWSAPLLVATDPADMSDEKRSILMNEEVLAVHGDPMFVSGERLYNKTMVVSCGHVLYPMVILQLSPITAAILMRFLLSHSRGKSWDTIGATQMLSMFAVCGAARMWLRV